MADGSDGTNEAVRRDALDRTGAKTISEGSGNSDDGAPAVTEIDDLFALRSLGPALQSGFRRWADSGFMDALIPVVPGDVSPERFRGDVKGVGKVPAVCNGNGDWRPMRNWNINGAAVAQLDRWASWGANVGLRTSGFPCFDIDVDDPTIAVAILGAIQKALPFPGPVRRRKGSPRCAVLTRQSGNALRKQVLKFRTSAGVEEKLELLADGQQLVVEGTHRSGARLTWDETPVAQDLPELSEAFVEIVFSEVKRVLQQLGCNDIHRTLVGKGTSEHVSAAPLPVGDALEAELERAKKALGWIHAESLDHDDWLRIGLALHAGLGDAGFLLWDDWSAVDNGRYPGTAELRKRWRSFTQRGGITLATLYHMSQTSEAVCTSWAGDREGPPPEDEFADYADAAAEDDDGGDSNGSHDFTRLNREWFVLDESGKLVVCRFETDMFAQGQQRKRLVRYSFDAFKKKHERTGWWEGGEENPRWLTLGQAWLEWSGRRQYDRAIFDPTGAKHRFDVLNLWGGWAVAPAPGDWSVIRTHIEDVICSGNAEQARYLLGWMARLFQKPGEPGEVVPVLRGKEGVGKGMLGLAIRRAVGQHGLAVANPKHVVGNFNSHLRDLLFLQCDEAFFAGDRGQTNQLKALITDDMLLIEPKGIDPIPARNLLHILMTTNEDWAVAAGPESRRYFVLDVSDKRRGDRAYFKALIHGIQDDQVIAAMLHDLLHWDLLGFNVRDVPVTTALLDQRERSLTGIHAWARDCAARGYLVTKDAFVLEQRLEWRPFFSTHELYADYERWHRDERYGGRKLPRETFGKLLKNVLELEHKTEAPRVLWNKLPEENRRKPGYWVGELSEFGERVRRACGLSDG